MIKISLSTLLIAATTILTVGCSEAERTYDCAQICSKWADCHDEDLDETDCVDKCEDEGDADADFEMKANECEACLDDSSCTEATFECATDCAGVIAEST
jgi:hypothetical protein